MKAALPALFLIPALPLAALTFQTGTPQNDLQGEFQAQIEFAQSQIIPPHPRADDRQPHLVGLRETLLLVRPLQPDGSTPVSVTIMGADSKVLGTTLLDPPAKLPLTAYHLEGVPAKGIDFQPKSDSTAHVHDGTDLKKLGDAKAPYLAKLLDKHDLVTIDTADGRWVGDIHFPEKAPQDGKVIEVKSQAGYNSTIHYSGRHVGISRGQAIRFQFIGTQWIREGEPELNALLYADNTWSTKLPASCLVPGFSLLFRQGNRSGKLADIEVGAPTEILLHTIDMGMLVSPRGQFVFAQDPSAHREYFQTVPTSRLIVNNYNPLTLDEVRLPEGTLLTDFDPSEGGAYDGTMRQVIGKELISIGIDNANYGINSSAGRGEETHPYYAAQLTAHNNRGQYANGLQVHGLSGGGGIVTLENSIGNEFSHEVGHNYGLGHYVDGFKGSVHRSAGNPNSTWGWDADKNRFIPNFYPTRGGEKTCLDGQCQDPFDGQYSFGKDAMAGGSPFSGFNRFTLYTPNSAALIQQFLESKVIFAAGSPTGFLKWNALAKKMEPWRNVIVTSTETTAPVDDLGEQTMSALLEKNDLVTVAMSDGNWTKEIHIPAASRANAGRALRVHHSAGYSSLLFLGKQQIDVPRGFQKTYVSDGRKWEEKEYEPQIRDRRPQAFGVPVTTLVGYYDPESQLPTSIFPALHGAYGYCYGPDNDQLTEEDIFLQVKTRNGNLRFRLAPTRLKSGLMNKFHINIPQSVEPSGASVIRNGKVLDKRPIAPPASKPSFTVNGNPLPER